MILTIQAIWRRPWGVQQAQLWTPSLLLLRSLYTLDLVQTSSPQPLC